MNKYNKASVQGFGMYLGEEIVIIGSFKEKLLIIKRHNPVTVSQWVHYTELDKVTWVIGNNSVA